MTTTSRWTRRPAASLFLALSCLYLLLSGGHIYSPDGTAMYGVTRGLMEGELAFRAFESNPTFGGPEARVDPDGQIWRYSKYGLGMSLVGVVPHLISQPLAAAADPTTFERGFFNTGATMQGPQSWRSDRPATEDDPRSFRRLWYSCNRKNYEFAFGAWAFSTISAFSMAASAAMLIPIARLMGCGLRAAMAAALLAGLATPMLHYGRTSWSEPLATALVVGAALLILRHRARPGRAALLGSGLAFGAAILTKPALVLLGLPALGLLFYGRPGLRRGLIESLTVAAGASPMIAIAAGYNIARFGSPLVSGYRTESWSNPPLEGVYALLASPGRGLLIYCPLVIAAALATQAAWRRAPEVALFAWGAMATLIALYAPWHSWEGGWCWGPRFLLPAIPLVALLLASHFDDDGAPPWRRRVVVAIAATSALVALNGVVVNPHDYYQWLRRFHMDHVEQFTAAGAPHFFELLRWDWDYAPIVRWWSFPVKETMIAPRVIAYPGVFSWIVLAELAGLLVGAVAVSRCWQSAAPGSPTPRLL